MDLPLPPPPPQPEAPAMEETLPSPPPPVNNSGPVKYFPSETFRLIQEEEKGTGNGEPEEKTAHSRSFLMLQKHLDR